jgi:gas vesicle protein|tara:strand:+ start:309 stop:536 length:228 start_codon:yes stop_codon:yes gene_type:complete
MDNETLLNLKEKIEEGKVKLNKLEGQREEALKTLEEFGCDELKSAKRKLKKMKEEVDKDSEILNKQIEQLSRRIK